MFKVILIQLHFILCNHVLKFNFCSHYQHHICTEQPMELVSSYICLVYTKILLNWLSVQYKTLNFFCATLCHEWLKKRNTLDKCYWHESLFSNPNTLHSHLSNMANRTLVWQPVKDNFKLEKAMGKHFIIFLHEQFRY